MYSEGIERVHWERMGLAVVARTGCLKQEAVGVFRRISRDFYEHLFYRTLPVAASVKADQICSKCFLGNIYSPAGIYLFVQSQQWNNTISETC